MKIRSILSIAAAGLLLAACQNSGDKAASGLADETAKADSLMYYFGQLRGSEYEQQAMQDTTLDSKTARQEYLKGVQAGLNAVKAGKDAYNNGVFLGMQMAMNMSQFAEDYGVKLSNKAFVRGMREAVMADSVTANPNDLQQNFYRLMGEFNSAREKRDSIASADALVEEASAKKYTKVTDGLYSLSAPADGVKIKDGDKVKLALKITTPDGNQVNAPLPDQITVGKRMAGNPVNDALLTLASGQTGKFMTTAHNLFGQRSAQMGLKPSDVLLFEVTPTVEAPKDAPAAE